MKKRIDKIKETFVSGMRVRLLKMDDIQASPIGINGTIRGINAIGSVMVEWDIGSHLSVILEEDVVEMLDDIKTFEQ